MEGIQFKPQVTFRSKLGDFFPCFSYLTISITICVSDARMLDQTAVVVPRETNAEDLLVVHTQSYLDSLRVCSALAICALRCEKLEIGINLCSSMYTFLVTFFSN